MPDEIRETRSPNLDQRSQELMKIKYGATDWYNWALNAWNTKWGAYDQEWDEGSLHFTTAWSPVHLHLIEELCELIQDDVFYYWEEEQGFGAEVMTKDFKIDENDEYDLPKFGDQIVVKRDEYTDEYWELETPYYKLGKEYPTGYYANGIVEEDYISHKEMIRLLKSKKVELIGQVLNPTLIKHLIQ